MARLAVQWWWLLGFACGVGGCRGHEALCRGSECAATPGEGGAPPNVPEGTSGEAGAPIVPACASDRQCQNESTCDGAEVCTATGCEPGPVYECAHGTTCDDEAPELCSYEEPSPWLLAVSLGALVALPAARLGIEQAFTLAPDPGEDLLEGFNEIFWAPDGEVAIIRAREELFGSSFHYARFRDGLPSEVSLLPDVPNYTGGETTPEFSADSEYVFIRDPISGTYLLNLKDPSVPTRYFPASDDGSYIDTRFCAAPHTWFASSAGEELHQAWIATLEGDEIVQSSIGSMDDFAMSGDRRLLALDHGLDDEGHELGFVLRPCSNEPWSFEFPAVSYYGFSPDSQWLWIEDNDGVQKIVSLEEPSAPVELFSSDGLGATLNNEFTPNGRYLRALVDGAPHLLDLSQAASQPLVPLPGIGSTAVLRNAALLAWSSDEAKPDQLVWQSVPPNGTPLPLLDDVTSDNARFVDDTANPERVFLIRVVMERSELFGILLDGSAPEAKLLLTIEGTFDTLTATPDHSGIVFARNSYELGGTLMFAPFEASGALGTPVLVTETGWIHEFQPWP